MGKNLSEITRKEWIMFEWREVPTDFEEPERVFVKGQARTPSEAMQAAEEWELLQSVKNGE